MSHVCGRTSSAKNKASKVFYRKIKPASKDTLSTGKVGADCRCGKCNKSESQHRMKRLRTRKERNQIRDERKSCHHYYNHHTSKDVCYVHQCCHSSLDAFTNIVPVAHEPSVITDSRLIGHHGLFNHEVKSIDIERLLSEQRKLDKSEKLQEKNNLEFANPSAKETECLLDSTNEEAVISNKKDLETPRIFNYSKRQEKIMMESNGQVSDLTPGQRPKNNVISSTETNKNDNFSDVVFTGINEAQPDAYANNSDSHQTPCSFNENNKSILPRPMPSIAEHTPKKHASATNLLLPSSPMSGVSSSLITQQQNLDADSVAMSVKAIAASLCNSISFSLLRKKDLVAETRETLVKVLCQRHGTQLGSNIWKIKQWLYSFDNDQEEGSELCCSTVFTNRKELTFSPGEFPTQPKATGLPTSSFGKTEILHFDWNSTDWSNPLDKTSKWFETPPENPVIPDNTFSCRGTPQFSMDFEFRKAVSRDMEHLFSPSFAPSCVDGPSSSHVNNFFITTQGQEFTMPQQKTKKDVTFSDITTVRHRQSPLTSVMNNYGVDPLNSVPFPQMHSSFEKHKYSCGKSLSDEIPYFHQEYSFEPYQHVNSALRPVDLAHYPPSYMLEKSPILSMSSYFPSPEHWSFPPMRLY
ncbi:uncharacterized protein si:dkey-250k15.4 [Periophthalmus magnuspinnatus]|uniref:uncharacterized protein si:dkey-250k15.4 n=1 Tax=Periophthalmus magnuspinnatus TaxID=409849 RepID=UPI0024366403|nr:uncharacterized protein si:dkey-250k15.4 [Periophthalmus magnuspinnatus]